MEFVVWSIPALTVMLLGGVIWISSHELDPRAPISRDADPLRWRSWRSIGNGCSSTLIRASPPSISWSSRPGPRSIPAHLGDGDELLRAAARDADLHDGRHDHALNLLADEPGEYPGFSANFSGDGFSKMRFIAEAVPAGDFEPGSRRCAAPGLRSTMPATPNWRSRARPCRRRPTPGRAAAVRAHRRPDASGAERAGGRLGAAGGRLRCWAS